MEKAEKKAKELVLKVPSVDIRMMVSPTNTTILSEEEPMYITHYDSNENCILSMEAEVATTYKLIPTSICSPVLVSGQVTMFYVFIPDRTKLRFNCLDQSCQDCLHEIDIVSDGSCQNLESGMFSVSTKLELENREFIKYGNGSRQLHLYYDSTDQCLSGDCIQFYFNKYPPEFV